MEFQWTKRQGIAFKKLKKALINKPVVKIFDPVKELTLTTDASNCVIAAILLQEDHPEMYLSRKLTLMEVNYSNIEKEALVIESNMERAKRFSSGKENFIQI